MRAYRPRLAVCTAAWRALLGLAWETWPLETGGVVLGLQGHSRSLVAHVIGPGPAAIHEARTFTPDHAWQAAQSESLWRANRQLRYLGDWHTHPMGRARLSHMDVDALRLIAGSPAAFQPSPIMLVAALGANGNVVARASRLSGGRRLERLSMELVAAERSSHEAAT